jgi:hypothetical protein
MVWRETVHFLQPRSMVIPIKSGATIAGAVKSTRVAERIAAHGIADKSIRTQEVRG